MASDAVGFLVSQTWCSEVIELRYADGVGGVVAVFLAKPRITRGGERDEWLWVIVGDLPSAYLVLDHTEGAADALEGYCELMEDWARAVLDGGDLSRVFPVDARPSEINAEDLLSRVRHLREKIVPWMREGGAS